MLLDDSVLDVHVDLVLFSHQQKHYDVVILLDVVNFVGLMIAMNFLNSML